VTGGSGFIGSNLVKELKSRGHDVWLCDLLHSEKMNFVRCDVGVYHQVERLFDTRF
jgi:dTDP-glucose 4,6-dehydratase